MVHISLNQCKAAPGATGPRPVTETPKAEPLPLFFVTCPGHEPAVLDALPLATSLRLLGKVPGARLSVIDAQGTKHNILHPSQLRIFEAKWELHNDTETYVLIGFSNRLNSWIPLARLGYFDLSPTERRQWLDNTLAATLALLAPTRSAE